MSFVSVIDDSFLPLSYVTGRGTGSGAMAARLCVRTNALKLRDSTGGVSAPARYMRRLVRTPDR